MCQNPINLQSARSRKNNKVNLPVPCGQCAECKKAKLSAWLFRFEQQLKESTNPLFVTLTYKDECVPYGEGSQCCLETGRITGYKSLYARHLQLFMKKLRFHHGKKSARKLVFMGVGEYGSRTMRPHYHIILLNLDTTGQKTLPNGKIYNPLLAQTWEEGFNYTLPLEEGGIQYVMKYLHKEKIRPPGCAPMFARFSQGIGLNYLTKARQDFHLQGPQFAYHRLSAGGKIPLIKYFKERLYTSDQRLAVTEFMQQRAEERKQKKIEAFAVQKRKSTAFSETLLEYRKKAVKLSPETIKADAL